MEEGDAGTDTLYIIMKKRRAFGRTECPPPDNGQDCDLFDVVDELAEPDGLVEEDRLVEGGAAPHKGQQPLMQTLLSGHLHEYPGTYLSTLTSR